MRYTMRLLFTIFLKIVIISADTYKVKIGSEQHVNVIDSRFLSFTIDPKYLFSTSGKYSRCVFLINLLNLSIA